MVTLKDFHLGILLTEPSAAQQAFYDSGMNGLYVEGRDEDMLLAAFILGLHRGRLWDIKGTEPVFRPVFFAVPRPLETWTFEVLNARLNAATKERKRVLGVASSSKLKKNLKASMESLTIGCRIFNMREPATWVSYGFPQSDERVPEWLREKLFLPHETTGPTQNE